MAKKLSDLTSTGRDLVTAALKIAATNHYMVGFAADTTDGVSFDDLSDAKQLLIDMELQDAKQTHRYDLAFHVLDALCMHIHNCHI